MITYLDGIEGGRVRRSASGLEAVREAMLEGLGGAPEARLYRALTHPGLPAYGSPHPGVPGIELVDMEATAVDVDKAKVTMTYRAPTDEEAAEAVAAKGGIISLEIDTTTVTERTDTDGDGNLMTNVYRGPNPVASGSVIWVDAVELEIARPQMIVRLVKDYAARPLALAAQYTSTINAGVWSGYPARTWLCNAIRSGREKGRWRTTFEFIYNRFGWDRRHTVRVYGVVPEQAAIGNGIKVLRPYTAENWDALGVKL